MGSLQTQIVLRKMVAYDVFTIVAIYTSAIGLVARGQDDCAGVETGLKPILDPCTRSVAECVTAQNLKALGAIFCLPKAEMQFNNFNKCTSRNFSDQLFGALCGGSDCSGTGGALVLLEIFCATKLWTVTMLIKFLKNATVLLLLQTSSAQVSAARSLWKNWWKMWAVALTVFSMLSSLTNARSTLLAVHCLLKMAWPDYL